MTGNEYKKLIARYIAHTYRDQGVQVYEEVPVGTSIIGKQRRVDVFVKAGDQALAIECKFQDSSGTVDEKIPYALDDLAAMRMPGSIVYAGGGFSEGVLHLLQSSEYAAYCLPDPETLASTKRKNGEPMNSGTWQLDHVIATGFGWWDLLTANKQPIVATFPNTEPSTKPTAERKAAPALSTEN